MLLLRRYFFSLLFHLKIATPNVKQDPIMPEKDSGPRGPVDMTGFETIPTLAMTRWEVEYDGCAAHAAGFPH
jgi:hypothetical protein